MMKVSYFICVLVCLSFSLMANAIQVEIRNNEDGYRLQVDGKDFMVKGVNWDYFPIGTNYTYNFWEQPDSFIKAVLAKEMPLVKNMGINALRIYRGIPKRWIAYIYEHYSIYTMLNHPFGKYGVMIENEWMANTDYSDPRVKELLIKETTQLVRDYKDTPGLLLYLLGNENNYSLFWRDTRAEEAQVKQENRSLENRGMYKLFLLSKEKKKEAVPEGPENTLDFDQLVLKRAKALYSLFNEAAIAIKSMDSDHPIALCNGDIMFLKTIKEACPDIDIFGTNMYRGMSFGDTFQRVEEELDKPLLFTEFGADAYNAIELCEDQESQGYYLLRNWKEIYANADGVGGSKNAIGGFIFQFSDGWWKANQYENLDVHDTTATWNNGGYHRDDKNGVNNMNEEWFGVCSKLATETPGTYESMPRAAYFVLKEAHKFSPYQPGNTITQLENYFKNISLTKAIKQAQVYSESLLNSK